MSGCQTCGGYGGRHDPIAHGTAGEPEETNDAPLGAYTCPLWHRDADGWCIDETPHLAARRDL